MLRRWISCLYVRIRFIDRSSYPLMCTFQTMRDAGRKDKAARQRLTKVHLHSLTSKPIDNKPSHWVLPPGHWRLKLKICPLFHANMCKFDVEIKSYKDVKTIWIYHNHYLPCTYNSKRCRYVCNCYYYDRAEHISVAVDMRTLLDRKNNSSSSNGQVAAYRVTGLI